MAHSVKIGGQVVELAWTQSTARTLGFRASKIGVDPRELYGDFTKPRKAEYAVTAFLWLLLPDEVHRRFALPDDLCPLIEPEDAKDILAAVLGVIADMAPSDEKKSTSGKSPSPE